MFDLELKKKEKFVGNAFNYYFISLYADKLGIREKRISEFNQFKSKFDWKKVFVKVCFATGMCFWFKSVLIGPLFVGSASVAESFVSSFDCKQCYFCQKELAKERRRLAEIIVSRGIQANSVEELKNKLSL